MKIEDGRFYFVNNNFMDRYGEKYKLMKNKESGNSRPCYFCFRDKENENIIWFVPISKQVDKYKKIYFEKMMKYQKEPLNFVFGKVRNNDSVFLIQNMFPCIEKYIENKYKINRVNDVTIFEDTKIKVIQKARVLLRLTKEKNIRIAFSDLIAFKEELLNELKQLKY